MSLPELSSDGYLPPGLHAATLKEVQTWYGLSSLERQQQFHLLQSALEAAQTYPSIKRLLVWGSFVSAKPIPRDLDYSIVVSIGHRLTQIAPSHRRFLVASEARLYYGTDTNYLVIYDYPLEYYIEKLDFLCHARDGKGVGVVEISLRGEFMGELK